MLEKEYSEEKDFFKISEGNSELGVGSNKTPMTPWVLVEFRVAEINVPEGEDPIGVMNKALKNQDENIKYKWVAVSTRRPKANRDPMIDFSDDIEKKGTLEFDNFFEGVTLEDNGAIIKCNLKLYDKDYGNLEDIILQSILATKLGNEKIEKDMHENALSFKASGRSSLNFRITYGYSDDVNPNVKIVDKFEERTLKENKSKMTMKSETIYFQMMNFNFVLTDKGLMAEVSGISMAETFLNKLKLLKMYSILEGTPSHVISSLGCDLFYASEGRISIANESGDIYYNKEKAKGFFDSLPPDLQKQDTEFVTKSPVGWKIKGDKDYEIQVPYGSQPKVQYNKTTGALLEGGVLEYEWMTVENLIKDVCRKIPTAFYREDPSKNEGIVRYTSGKDIKIILENQAKSIKVHDGEFERSSFKPVKYTYALTEFIEQDSNGNSVSYVKLRFFYQFPQLDKQPFVRKYNWRNNSNTLITSFGIKSTQDFASAIQKIAVISQDGGPVSVNKPSTSGKDITDNTTGASIEISNTNTKEAMLFSDVIEFAESATGESGKFDRRLRSQQIISNMNEQSFKGSITIPGDPFFRFSSTMQKLQYGIWISVKKDRNYYVDKIGSPLKESYMSGFYLISTISHSLGSGGFTTTLGLVRWPTSSIILKK